MRRQPKRLPRITWEKWWERHFICFGFVSYRKCFLHSQPPFCAVVHFVCFSARLAVHYFAVYSVLFISLLLFTKVHKTTTWNRHISSAYLREREPYDGQFLKFLLSNFEAVLHILFGSSDTICWDKLNGLCRCYRCCLSCFFLLSLGSERLPALSTICLFGCQACVWRFVCRLSFVICVNISLPFIQLLLFEQDTSVFYLNSH